MVENVEGTGLVQTGSSRGYSEEFTRVGGRELVRLGEYTSILGECLKGQRMSLWGLGFWW